MTRTRTGLRWLLAALMIVAGALHFANPGFYVALIPPSWPARLAAVYASGVAEIACGALLLWPRPALQRLGAWAVVATLIAVFPANIYHATSGGLTHPDLPPLMANGAAAWARLPLQLVLIYWAVWLARPSRSRA